MKRSQRSVEPALYGGIVKVRMNGVNLEFDGDRCEDGLAILRNIWLDERFPPIVDPARERRWNELQARKKNAETTGRNVR